MGWEVISPINDIGWRLRKHYYDLKCKSLPKEEIFGSWTDYGPDKYLDDREMHAVFKSLCQIQVSGYIFMILESLSLPRIFIYFKKNNAPE